MFRMYAGEAIQLEFGLRAARDPITAGKVSYVGRQRPGPDFKGDAGIYYELTTVQSLSSHLSRPGIRPANASTRFILYPGF